MCDSELEKSLGDELKNKVKNLLKSCRLGRYVFPFLARGYFLATCPIKRYHLHQHGWRVLSQLHTALSDAGILYFVDFGTLLGMIREGHFLGHDADIDLGILDVTSGTQARVHDALSQHGYRLIMSYWYKDRCVAQSYMCGSVKVDFCYYEESPQYSCCWLFYCNMKERNYPSKDFATVYEIKYRPISGIRTIVRQGVEMNVPEDPEQLLEDKYGPGWKKPDKGWRYWLAPGARECSEFGKIINH